MVSPHAVHRSAGDPELVRVERIGVGERFAACVMLDRPERLNAIGWTMLGQLQERLDEVRDDPQICVVLLTGRGRAFCSGGDIADLEHLQADPERFPRFVEAFNRVASTIRRMETPVVALVNGVCVAGGLELMLACDFAWAAESARIGDLHLNYAQVGGAGAMSYLPRLIGPNRARELVFSARLLSATEALDWGLVNRVLPDAELLPAALDMARGLAGKSAAAVRTVKRVINAGLTTGVEDALRYETASALLHCLTLPDARAGASAFVQNHTSQSAGA